ncbi:MAG: penicillin acylase family protein [Deltaproteobacteria bacterium]|nr:MAG: penicillin acylase family protein [Deltaproteobacteria bacterium]
MTPRILPLLALLSCTGEYPAIDSPIADVDVTDAWLVPGLRDQVHVVYTEAGVPHLYAENRRDLARVQGFVVARERFFQVDLVRRLSQGKLSALLGDLMLEADLEARGISMTYHTHALEEKLTPEQREIMTAYAEGFNDYIRAVELEKLPPPSEYELLGPLLQADEAYELMEPFTLTDIAAIGGTILFRLGYETGDIGVTRDVARFDTHFAGAPLESLRTDALWEVWSDQTPVYDEPSATGFGATARARLPQNRPRPPRVNPAMLDRLAERMDRIQDRLGRDHEEGWGSNAWAVDAAHSRDGRAILAGDGHLELDIPALLMAIGLDTAELGGGDIHQVGLVLVGMPVLSIGTNGNVAWSQTQHSGDITDWYAEELTLDADGYPASSLFQGQQQPVVRMDESIEVAGRLGSEERTETWPRWETFDGRWITEIEGRRIGGPDDAPGEAVINLSGTWLVPGDEDGDGTITAISFDFTGLDKGNLFAQYDALGTSHDLDEFHEGMKKGLALSQNLLAADVQGDIYYNGYQMVPCRGYLPRNGDGSWVDGADPRMLIDGTTYGGFTIPIGDDFAAIEGDSDPYRCVVPFDDYPHSFTNERGYLLSANQDPGGLTSDGTVLNDSIYIGGPWDDGYRADTIARGIQTAIAGGGADIATMSGVQGDHESVIARRHLDDFLDAIRAGQALAGTTPAANSSDERLLATYTANQARFDEVLARLADWQTQGQPAESGVVTFYNPEVTAQDEANAVATTVFNVWLGDVVTQALNDEGLPGAAWQGGGTAGRLRVLDRMFRSRGANNPLGLAGYNPDTEEHVFWDHRSTTEIETSDEIVLLALEDALDFLTSEPTGEGEGGFGTADMDAWIWGLRHQVEFGSLVGSYVDDPLFGPIFDRFAITTEVLPLEEGMDNSDPRAELQWFPRNGDNRNVDAANPGLSGRRFRYGSGPVMRMVFAVGGPDNTDGVSVIPGGQSGLVDSEHFSDQAGLWLGNETLPLPLGAEDVSAAAVRREVFVPR